MIQITLKDYFLSKKFNSRYKKFIFLISIYIHTVFMDIYRYLCDVCIFLMWNYLNNQIM